MSYYVLISSAFLAVVVLSGMDKKSFFKNLPVYTAHTWRTGVKFT